MVDLRPVRRDSKLQPQDGLTASAQILTPHNTRQLIIDPTEWQRECWDFYHTLGEFRYAVSDWFGNAISRIRLVPAISMPGEEPTAITEGPAFDLMNKFIGGIGGQAAILKKFAIHLIVPGDSYLVGEETAYGQTWTVFSSDEIRIKSRGRKSQNNSYGKEQSYDTITYEVMEMEAVWRTLSEESLVVRIWNPDEQFSWKATSPAQAALPIMREIDYYNRYIISVLLSRLVLNGMLLIPAEVTFPVKEAFKDSADPFIAEIIDIASKAIQNPGSAAAALPMPLKIPSEYIEKFRHLTFDTPMGEKVLEDRERALSRLATALNMPAEILTGVSKMNHWGQWQLEESAIKIHLSPIAEIICVGLTRGYLYPMLRAANKELTSPDGGRYIIWYDTSELSQAPDKTGPAKDLYDRGEIDGKRLRESSGFNPDDDVAISEFKNIALKRIALSGGADAMRALAALTGDETLIPPVPTPPVASNPGDSIEPNGQIDETSKDVVKAPPATQPTDSQPTPGEVK